MMKHLLLLIKKDNCKTILALLVAKSGPVFRLDANNAFLLGDLKEVAHMTPPLGWKVPNTTYGDVVVDIYIGSNKLHVDGLKIFSIEFSNINLNRTVVITHYFLVCRASLYFYHFLSFDSGRQDI